MRIIPVIGGLVILGVVVQLLLGYSLGSASYLRNLHTILGIIGLTVIAGLAALAITRGTASNASRIVMALLTLFVASQVWLGVQRLGGGSYLAASHQYTGLVILGLVTIQAFISYTSHKKGGRR